MSTKKNAAYNVAYRIFSLLLPLVTAPYLSRTVGTEGVGLYTGAWTTSEIFCLIAMLGLADYGVRTIAQVRDNRKELDKTFSGIWQMQLIVASITLLFWLGYVFLVAGKEKTIALHLTMMSVSCLCSFDWCLMGLDQFKPIALRNTFVKVVAAVCVFVFVKSIDDLWIYGFAWSLATLLGNLSCVTSLKGRVSYHRVSLKETLKHLRPCAVLFISVAAVTIYRKMDKEMVFYIAGDNQTGLYEHAEKIVYCLSGFISAIGTVMLTKVTNLQKKGETEKIARNMDKSMNLVIAMVTSMAFGLAAVADRFAPLFYGEESAYSGTLMIPLGFTLIMIGFANVIRTQVVLPQKRDHILVRSVCTGAVVNLIVNSCLIPFMGSMGAVIGTLAAEMTVPVVQFIFLRKEVPYKRFIGYVGIYAVMGGIMLVCVRLVGRALPAESWLNLGIMTVTGVIVYGVMCLVWWKVKGNSEFIIHNS